MTLLGIILIWLSGALSRRWTVNNEYPSLAWSIVMLVIGGVLLIMGLT